MGGVVIPRRRDPISVILGLEHGVPPGRVPAVEGMCCVAREAPEGGIVDFGNLRLLWLGLFGCSGEGWNL